MVAATPNGRNAPPIAGRHARSPAERLARRLGWFSVALGVPQIVAPGRMNELVGIHDTPRNRAVMRAIGFREIGGGAGILAQRRPGGLLFLRVVGDALDLLLLRAALRARGSVPSRIAAAAAAVLGVAALDAIASAKNRGSADPGTEGNTIRARSSVTINRPPDEVYRFWRDIENLPSFMYHLESVQRHDETRSHWIAKGPARLHVEWDAEIVEDVPGEKIAWWSLAGSDVRSTGCVTFTQAPAEQGTEVTVDLQYAPPAGAVGAAIARLFGEEPTQQIKDDLRRLKQVMETGEVVRSVSIPEGTRSMRQFLQRAGQPRD